MEYRDTVGDTLHRDYQGYGGLQYKNTSGRNDIITGYDYLINKKVSAIELAVPRRLLGLAGNALSFDFHWCDNPADLKDPISLCLNGDSAPNRRFNYRCIWKK